MMEQSAQGLPAVDPTEAVERLLRDRGRAGNGLSSREAQRRLLQYGPNELVRRGGRRWPRELARQFTHPLALLLVARRDWRWSPGSSRWRSRSGW